MHWRLEARPAPLCEALHATPLRFEHCTQFMHLAGEPLDLLTQFTQWVGPAPRARRHRAGSGRTARRILTIAHRRAADFGSPAAIPVARFVLPHFGTALPRCKRTRRRFPAFFTAGLGARRLRIRTANLGTRLIRIRPAGLGILAGRPFGFAARLIWRLGICRACETQGRKHAQEELRFHESSETPGLAKGCRRTRPPRQTPRAASATRRPFLPHLSPPYRRGCWARTLISAGVRARLYTRTSSITPWKFCHVPSSTAPTVVHIF